LTRLAADFEASFKPWLQKCSGGMEKQTVSPQLQSCISMFLVLMRLAAKFEANFKP